MRSPITLTNRAVALVAGGVPLFLLAGAAISSLGVVGFAWLALVPLLMLADALFCVTGTVPQLQVQTPGTRQVGLTNS